MAQNNTNEVEQINANNMQGNTSNNTGNDMDLMSASTATGDLEGSNFLERWFSHQEKWSVENIWRYILNGGSRDVNKDVNSFLPIRIPVKQWCESLRCESSSLSFSVKEFVYKTSSVLYVDEAGKKAKSFAKLFSNLSTSAKLQLNLSLVL